MPHDGQNQQNYITHMKKQKTSHGAAEVYDLLTLPDKRIASRKVAILADQSVLVLADKDTPVPPEYGVPDKIFENMDALLASNPQTILAYHAQFLGVEPPKKQDTERTAFYLWAWMAKNGKPILSEKTHHADGTPTRKSTIGSRVYTVLPVPASGHGLKTPQAITCLKIVTESADPTTMSITEEALKAKVIERQLEIKTRQDPWRIFQYYRPTLIASKLLKHD